jgi:ribose/xylose/arabinose/galactoside ABC-type transport system permease subunit
MRVLAGFLGLVLATLLGLYALFLVLYQGEEGSEGDTYLNVGGKKIDADVVGVPLLLVAAAVVAVLLWALRRRDSRD